MKTTKSTKKFWKLSKNEIISSKQDTINKLNELRIQDHDKIKILEAENKKLKAEVKILKLDNLGIKVEKADLLRDIEKWEEECGSLEDGIRIQMLTVAELEEERDAMDKQIDISEQKICDLEDVAEDFWAENAKLKADLKSLEDRFDEVISKLVLSREQFSDVHGTLLRCKDEIAMLDNWFKTSDDTIGKRLAYGKKVVDRLHEYILTARRDFGRRFYPLFPSKEEK